MTLIQTLRPNVRREQALRCFRPPGPAGWLCDLQQGPLRRVAEAYVPFRLYRIEIGNGARRQTQLLAMDAVRGLLDLYAFERAPEISEIVAVESRNVLPSLISETRARDLVIEQARRIIYRTGFFRLRSVTITAKLVPLDFHVPYWLGFSGAGEHAALTVLDAIRRRLEGAKARALFKSWLLSGPLAPGDGPDHRPGMKLEPPA